MSGTLADPFTATSMQFEYGGRSEADIDHLVALSDGRQKGDRDAATWLPYCKDLPTGYGPYALGVDPEYDRYTGRDKDGGVRE